MESIIITVNILISVISAYIGLSSHGDSLLIANLYKISAEVGQSALALQHSFRPPAIFINILSIVLALSIAKVKIGTKWFNYVNIVLGLVCLLVSLV